MAASAPDLKNFFALNTSLPAVTNQHLLKADEMLKRQGIAAPTPDDLEPHNGQRRGRLFLQFPVGCFLQRLSAALSFRRIAAILGRHERRCWAVVVLRA